MSPFQAGSEPRNIAPDPTLYPCDFPYSFEHTPVSIGGKGHHAELFGVRSHVSPSVSRHAMTPVTQCAHVTIGAHGAVSHGMPDEISWYQPGIYKEQKFECRVSRRDEHLRCQLPQ